MMDILLFFSSFFSSAAFMILKIETWFFNVLHCFENSLLLADFFISSDFMNCLVCNKHTLCLLLSLILLYLMFNTE